MTVRAFKRKRKSRGLGDDIEKALVATGVHAIVKKVEKVTNRDCGCSKRRDSLNRKFPYKK